MLFHRLRLRPLAFIAALSALALTAFAFAPRPWVARAAAQAPPTFDLRDFGAAGDGTTDDAPALQAALDALAAAGGGTLHVPAGRYVIASPVHKDFAGLAGSVTIRGVASETAVDTTGTPTQLATGLGLVSEFFPRTREAHVALSLRGLDRLLVTDIAFVGTPGVTTDAASTLAVEDVTEAVVRHCEFYGLSTLVSAVIHARRGGLHVEQTKFLGTVANSGIYAPVIDNLEWKSVSLADVVFLDYGLRPELFGKTGYGAPYSWVNVGNAAPVTADSPRREVSIRRVFLDEGGYVGLSSLPFRYSPATAPVDLYYVTGLRMNVSNLRTTGNYFDGLDALLVESSRYGWSHNADSAIYILRSGHAVLSRVHTEAAATRLRADASVGSLTVINSVYEDLASAAGATRVIETVQDADDPVWYVRQRFASALGREPDPAAHYYWSRRLLACAAPNDACTTAARAALENYLGAGPAPRFAVGGVVSDEQGGALAGVTLTLSGSQTVTTVTDDEGRYRFSNLPTSGVYTLTAARHPYTFAAPLVFETPAGDRSGNFTGLVARRRISGRLAEAGGAAINGATVTLSDADGPVATTTTDAEGRYTLANVAAGGDYTVTPRRLGYRFGPAALAFDDLDADRTADFTGTPAAHAVTGRVTTAGGAGLSGVTVTLAGSHSATTTTDANGNYAFNSVPAAGDYAVTPGGPDLVFAPANASFTNLNADAAANFSARYRVNHARASNGATAAASSTLDAARAASTAINGDRTGRDWGSDPATGSGWHDATNNSFPDTLEITFPGARTLDEVSVFSVQDDLAAPQEPTEALTFTKYGVTALRVEYWTGAAWAVVPGGLVASNNQVWRKVTFAPLQTTKIRVVVNSALAGHSRLTEVEAWSTADAPPTPPAPTAVNHALASNGATAAASSTLDAARSALAAINGDRRGSHWGSDPATGSGWHDATNGAFPDTLEVVFAGARTINTVNVFSVQDNFAAPQEPTEAQTFSLYGLVDFEVQYWTGAAWATLPGAAVTGNNKARRSFTFAPVTTDRVRLVVTKALAGYTRVAELEAWWLPPAAPRPNVASAANGATVAASSTLDAPRTPLAAINGDRTGHVWGIDPAAGSGWHDATADAFPDWLQINFAGAKTISEVSVFSVQDDVAAPQEPTEALTFSLYGATAFHLEYWTGAAWAVVPGASVAGNDKVWRRVTFAPVTTDRVRVVVTGALAGHSRLTEVEVY